MEGLYQTDFEFPGQSDFYRGKVRDIYYFGEQMAVVASDRISAFDTILPKVIPFKGQILNLIAAHFLTQTAHIVPNWLEAMPHPNVSIGKKCRPFPVEMVVRRHLVGHAWREYSSGRRQLCGVPLPEGMRENDPFPEPILTPTTKAHDGHDQDISAAEIVAKGLVSAAHYAKIEAYSRELFAYGFNYAAKRGLILADTKYEFGLLAGQIMLIDEVHTPDSSRYFYAQGFEERQAVGEPQKQLSKEFVRKWLIKNSFQGLPGQKIPEMPDTFIHTVSIRYQELYAKITGKKFEIPDTKDLKKHIKSSILAQINC